MFVASCWFASRWSKMAAGVLGVLGLCMALSARAEVALTSDMMPTSQLRAGMKGYGLTTFRGTTPSRFEIEVVGVVKKVNNGRDLIMIRITSGPMVKRGANLVQGMSGSPIYVKGRLIGGLSQGEQNQKEPLNMVTPIADMLDAWDPKIPQKPTYYLPATKPAPSPTEIKKTGVSWKPDNGERVFALPEPITIGNRRIAKLVLNAQASDARRSQGDTAVLHRATTYLSVTGMRGPLRKWFQSELDRLGYAVTVADSAGVSKGNFKGASLRPGSPLGAFLATGDVQVGSTGTLTYRKGKRILAFGHPLFSLGAVEMALTSAYIVDILSRSDVSHHIAIAGPTLGILRQDRDYSVSADLGVKPKMIPFTVTVRNHTHRRNQTFRANLFQHPELTPVLMRLVAQQAVTQMHNVPGDVMAKVTTTVDAAEVGRISRNNLVYDGSALAGVATQDLTEIVNVVSGNPFYPLPIKSASMTVDISTGHDTAVIERIYLTQGRYEPGDTLDIGVVLKPYRQPATTRTLSMKIPSNTPTGRYQLVVRGGAPTVQRIGSFVISSGAQDPQTPPVNVQQMVAQLNKKNRNTDIVARLVLNSVAPALEGEKLSQLPPNLSALMRSERNSGVRMERDELRESQPTNYVVTGTQQLQLVIVRKNTQEPTGGNGAPGVPNLTPPGSGLTLPSGSTPPSASFGDDLDTSTDDSETETAQKESPLDTLLSPADYDAETRRWIAAMQQTTVKVKVQDAPAQKEEKQAAPPPAKEADKAAGQTTPAREGAAAAPKPNPADEKPIGRQLKVWRQTSQKDFAAGDFHGTSISANGELRLTSSLRRIASTPETYIWSLVSDGQGSLYAGTGMGGKILKIDPEGEVTEFASLPVVSVQSLLRSKDGSLWAGSGVKGNLYRVSSAGTPTLVTSLPEKYIMALAQDSKGHLFIGPAGGGTVYRLKSDDISEGENSKSKGVKPEPYLKTAADYILALAVDAKDNLYVGTGNEGTLYKVTPDGKSSVLFSAKENAITALAVDAQGNILAGTGPRGLLYYITPDGKVTTLLSRAPSFFTSALAAPDGVFYACSVNAVYAIKPTPDEPTPATLRPLDNPKDVDFLALAMLPNGHVAAGTGNIGEIYTSEPQAQNGAGRKGVFDSVVRDATLLSRWGTARWNAMLPAGTHLKVETRSGNISEPDGTWSAWSEVRRDSGDPLQGAITSPPARFLQYRLTLESEKPDIEPIVREVSIAYMPRNQAPRVTFQSPAGGERWAKSQTIKWNGSDPDSDTLTYELFYSADMGATWKPFPVGEAKPASEEAKPAAKEPPMLTVEQVRQQLETTGIPGDQQEAYLERYRQRLAAANGTTGAASVLRETSRTLETKDLPDGTYLLKVIASDGVSNPTDALIGQTISEPFVIANAPPQITLAPSPVITGKSVALTGTAQQSLIAITGVQYRVDGGDWNAAIAKDGLFDSLREDFAVVVGPLASGKRTIEVSVFNAAGTRVTEKIEVTIP